MTSNDLQVQPEVERARSMIAEVRSEIAEIVQQSTSETVLDAYVKWVARYVNKTATNEERRMWIAAFDDDEYGAKLADLIRP
jgi:predicted dinucleotide-binding enzyme